ncbi:hypothetical protein CJ739_81 [Mariniflexile rhizosphaerae]|uniref:Thoeris anti-defense Tad2 family protein n=1 Tax=unclassified Mariniflexile TaxID=2643887 RepID=UPI000E3377C4|nr:MW1434 family type I TA system toxin [Mariniflexile sp. TRM1-10]AXP79181.1 hypothetical protein CJ739_81 [Mariniflexile sp. TRM1-10]
MDKNNLTLGEAVTALKEGLRVRRSSWSGDKKFVFRQVPAEIPAEVVPKMQSLPQKVKDYFQGTFEDENKQIASIYYRDQLVLVGLSNSITSYSPSVSDTLAIDWEILD